MAIRPTSNLPEMAQRRALATNPGMSAMMDELSKATEHVSEPIQLLWRQWQTLHDEAVLKCHRAQDLEAQLLRTVGAPIVRIRCGLDAEDLIAHSHEEIDHILAKTDMPEAIGEDLHRKLAKLQGEWNNESDRIGFAAAVQQEEQAWARERQAAEKVFHTPVQSLTGVQIKLALSMEKSADAAGDAVLPLSLLQLIFDDLTRLNTACGAS